MSMVQRLEDEVTLTVDNTDALSGRSMANAPGPGVMAIYLASTQADTNATVTIGGVQLKPTGVIGKVATNAQIDILSDTPISKVVARGEKVLVNIDVVTAATVRIKQIWKGLL